MEPSPTPELPIPAALLQSAMPPSLGLVFAAFLRIGATAFGGMAMIPRIEVDVVQRRKWISREAFQAGVALGQIIPGATVMQIAAYVGGEIGGPIYALAAFIGFALPAFLLMVGLSAAYEAFAGVPIGAAVFQGLEACVTAVIANAAVTYGRRAVGNAKQLVLAGLVIPAFIADLSPAVIVVVGGAAGIWLFQAADAAPASATVLKRNEFRFPVMLAFVGAVVMASLDWQAPLLGALAVVMVKVDIFAFGGAFGSIPLMLHEVVDVRHWMSPGPFMDGIALGQVTPGPVVITAAFVGWHVAHFAGAVVATVGVFFPSFVILLAVRPVAGRLRRHRLAGPAMKGISASVAGMIVATAVKLGLMTAWTPFLGILAACAFGGLSAGIGPLWIIVAGAALSGLPLP